MSYNYEHGVFAVEFYNNKRAVFEGITNPIQAAERQIKCNIQGGICFILSNKIERKTFEMIYACENKTKRFISLDQFIEKIPDIVQQQKEKEQEQASLEE